MIDDGLSLFPVPDYLVLGLQLAWALLTVVWVVSIRLHNVSIMDIVWSLVHLLFGSVAMLAQPARPAWPQVVLWCCLLVWALRLSGYIAVRSVGQPEDRRYQAFRREFGEQRYWWLSYFQVFLLQGAIAFGLSLPIQAALNLDQADYAMWQVLVCCVGLALFSVGLVFEIVADWQMAQHRASGKGGVLDSGLWRYSRHPNYFGESLLWLGFAVQAAGILGSPIPLISYLGMTFLLLKVSGVRMLEADQIKVKPKYRAYIESTSPFVPLPKQRTNS